MIIENSKDILYIVLSFSILWITIFLSWFLYHLISIVRQADDSLQDVRQKMQSIEGFVTLLKEKLEHSTTYLFVIAEGMKQAISYLMKKKFGEQGKDHEHNSDHGDEM